MNGKAMQDGLIERRNFLKDSARMTGGVLILKPSLVFGTQVNSAISLGILGCGNRGLYVGSLFAKNEYARIAALCDIFDDRLEEARKKYSGARIYRDYKELLASDIDAVLIATPAYLHPEHFEAAVAARKHIFMEKPVAVDAEGCKRVREAAFRADPQRRITVDFQQRYGKDYRRAHQLVRSGELGRILMVRASWFGGGPPLKTGHPPEQERVRNWFFYRELSGDILVEQDCHNIDVVNWFLDAHPVRVTGYGSRKLRFYGNIFDNVACTFEFADGTLFSYAANQFRTPGYQDVSETFICEFGTLTTSRQGYAIYRQGRPVERVETKYDITWDAVNEFVEGVRTGKVENAALAAADSTLTAVMALKACVTGSPVTWEEVGGL